MEQEAVRLSEQKTETEKKEEALSQALSRVWEDAQMLSLLQEKRDVVRGEQEKIEQETRALKTKIKETESALLELEAETEDSESVLWELEKLGEDVRGGKEILEERRQMIEASRVSLQEIKKMLGMAEESVEPTPPSKHTVQNGMFSLLYSSPPHSN